MSVYERPARPAGSRQSDRADTEFRDRLVTAIDEDPRIREAILRLFAANRAPKKTAPPPATRASIRRRGA
ncbi:hypothetical protein [Streptacidiphilus sp. EB129]|uniref:hypothetical protein n=1 Tax=Streptacidiphilus sp. EB129 TaxID=3156262 RepID=UPI0035150565